MKHCVHFSCLMQGSNSGPEGETKPHFLCPVCLGKLFFVLECDLALRYCKLGEWVEGVIAGELGGEGRSGEVAAAYEHVFGDWLAWYGRRGRAIGAAGGGVLEGEEEG